MYGIFIPMLTWISTQHYFVRCLPKKQTTCNHVGISNFVVNMITFFCNELRSQGCCIYNIDFVSFINRNKTTPNDWLNRSEVISNIGFMIRLE